MKQLILKTNSNYVGLILRLTIGLIIWPHGAQKMIGLFGGFGFTNTMKYFTETVNLPWILSLLVILIEFLGTILILIGWKSRILSILMIVLFIGIILTAHLDVGFFMNWFGTQKGEGFEFHLLVIGCSLALSFNGSGKWSIDAWLNQSNEEKSE